MRETRDGRPPLQLYWREERKVFTLEKVPVLELSMSWPQGAGGGRGGERISRYYQKLAQAWRSRWGRETYWLACLNLVRCREEGRTFQPWTAQLTGEVLFLDETLLSIRMDAREVRGDGRPLQVRTGDLWRLPEGVPLPVGGLFPGSRWRRKVLRHFREQGESRRAAGDCFLDPDFACRLGRRLPLNQCCRTTEGLEFYFPQGALAPAVEGPITFFYPLSTEAGTT